MNELLLDSADVSDIEQVIQTSAIVGVTTNPSLIAKGKKGDYLSRIGEIVDCLMQKKGKKANATHLSVELIESNPRTMVEEAKTLSSFVNRRSISSNEKYIDVYIKVPILFEYLPVISELSDYGIGVNATACMTWDQAFMAERAGANIVSFFYNRMIDGGLDPQEQIDRFLNVERYSRHSRIICGSIRKPEDIGKCFSAGVDIVTASLPIIKKFMQHDQTDKAVKQFQEDIDRWRS